ncbi:acyl-CoA N-acyltransferase [Fimicolochytrium jonesii]|uniref:acyl-CoA N-acyltransferase n=1 Tax=Fimicolochytrium jonesii TaxID=1396493 RepID=UPI0022FEFE6A|nr:acyl-CoA N-acyltransferase [Fimicolochytrium jonesii]KAI8817071.1 acyl-CoA N-acyltransferase [Fimicolochytrium jonesii]
MTTSSPRVTRRSQAKGATTTPTSKDHDSDDGDADAAADELSPSSSPRPRRSARKVVLRTTSVDSDSNEEKASPFCETCGGTSQANRESVPEALLACSSCHLSVHPTCEDLQDKNFDSYKWECKECKRCMECQKNNDDANMVFCDGCDRAAHTYCAGLKEVPEASWKCKFCTGHGSSRKGSQQKHITPHITIKALKARCPQEGCIGKGHAHDPQAASHTSLGDCPIHQSILNTSMPAPPPKKRGRPAKHKPDASDVDKTPNVGPTPEPTKKKPRISLVYKRPKTHQKEKRGGNKSASDHEEPEEPPPKPVPFGGKLSEEDADISTCTPGPADRAMYKKAMAEAEEQIAKAAAAAAAHLNPPDGTQDHDSSPAITNSHYDPHGTFTIPKIKAVQLGSYEIETWYSAPYPEEYNGQPLLYICEYCFKYMKSKYVAGRHKAKCPLRHPPGDEIYRDGKLSIFEVDGRRNKIYCQNLCLVAKMFLDHKTLYYDVEPFLFYILTENDERGCHFVGYFSKEKRSSANWNLSCIVTLPICQRKGYGGLLIEFSYLLSRREGRTGSPEKPLSDLGLLTYRRYWRRSVVRALVEAREGGKEGVTIEDLSTTLSMTPSDVIHTLYLLHLLAKNAHGDYVLLYPRAALLEYVEKADQVAETLPRVKPELLRWSPLVFKTPVGVQGKGEGDEGEGGEGGGDEEEGRDEGGTGEEDGQGEEEAGEEEA